jgi:replicative DNA helicase
MAKSYSGKNRTTAKIEKLRIRTDPYILCMMSLAFLTTNTRATIKFRVKLLELLESLDEEFYSDNVEILWRLNLALSIGRAVVHFRAKTVGTVELRVLENTEWEEYYADFFNTYRQKNGHHVDGYVLENELSDEDLIYLDDHISTRLRYAYLWKMAPIFREIADKIDADDLGGEVSAFNDGTLETLEQLILSGRKAKMLSSAESQDFTTGSDSFEHAIRETHRIRNLPQSAVKTGCRALNNMLGAAGGYEGSRTYVHFGRSGDWKSGMLCSAAFWACDSRFNPAFTLKDPTRVPCVFFLTQENDVYETIERMVSFALGSDVDLRGSDPDQIVQMLEEAFSSPTCKFIFKFRQSRSISTADIDTMIQELYTDGFEVIMLVQDYIKRVRSVEKHSERHLELGSIVDELSSIAKKYNIPVVTAMQLNRSAYAIFDAAIKSGREDAIKDLGPNNVGESINVYENSDVVLFQARVVSKALGGRLFLTMRQAKQRGKRKGTFETFFAQPFELDNSGEVNEMCLVEDAHLPEAQCRALLDIGDGIQSEYDANTHDLPPEERVIKAPPARRTGGRSSKHTPAVRTNGDHAESLDAL